MYDKHFSLKITQKNEKQVFKKKTCTRMFIAELFTVAKRCKQPNVHQSIKGQTISAYMHIMECYSATKRNELLMPATT